MRQVFYYKMQQFCYKMRQLLKIARILLQNATVLQNATFITNCDNTMCMKGKLFDNFCRLSFTVSNANFKLIYRKGHYLRPPLSLPPGDALEFIFMSIKSHKNPQ